MVIVVYWLVNCTLKFLLIKWLELQSTGCVKTMVDYGETLQIFAQQKGEKKYIVLFHHMNTLTKKFKKITKERQYYQNRSI